MNLEEIGITKEDLIDKIAEKIMQLEYSSDESEYGYDNTIGKMARIAVEKKVTEHVNKSVLTAIDDTLNKALSELLEQTVTPVDIFGDKAGEPTSIKAALATRAKDFWMQKVDKEGKASNGGWNTTSRYEHLMKEHLKSELDAVIKANLSDIVAGFKGAVREDCIKSLDNNISRFFR